MSDNDIGNEQESKVVEFDFPLPLNKISQNLVKRHSEIVKLLNIPKDDNHLTYIFTTVASLCDPFTQPEENEESILSIDCISDLLIALTYPKALEKEHEDSGNRSDSLDINSIKFSLSVQYFTLLQSIQTLLNANDELKLRYVNNDDDHWVENLSIWTPLGPIYKEEFNLKLVYSIACVLIVSIYKLFKQESGDYNLILNPYLQYFIKLWKCHTNIILLGLEIDRRIEFQNQERDGLEETPEIIKQTLKGSSSIRYVLAWIINQNPTSLYESDSNQLEKDPSFEDYDIKNETLLTFVEPLGRKKINGGSLSIDMRLVIVALLILNSGTSFTAAQYQFTKQKVSSEDEANRKLNQTKPIAELGDILIDLEYDDRFDEDIRYIFEYEYEDSEVEWSDVEDDEKDQDLIEMSESVPETKERKISTAVRSNEDSNNLQFDEFGRDWRDLPRGDNAQFQGWFLSCLEIFESLTDKGQSDDIFSSWDELYETFEFLSINSIEGDKEAEKRIGQVLINTVSKAIKDETENKDVSIMPDKIYQYWSTMASEQEIHATQENNKLIVPIFNITKFELFLHNNNKLARCLVDEMLMCKGYRRVLIWFITHNLNLSTLLIDYVFELLAGLRGNESRYKPYKFTRKGNKLILSEVEVSMLLHEFLTNSGVYLSATEGIEIEDGYKVVLAESIAKKNMSLMCLMINQLINIGVINLERKKGNEEADDIHDYSNELQVLLINWVGKLSEARELFFRIKNANYDNFSDNNKTTKEATNEESYDKEKESELIEKYSVLTTSEISEDLEINEQHLLILENFVDRIQRHIKSIIANQTKETSKLDTMSNTLNQVSEDFQFFFNNFNTLCKIEYVAEALFDRFETIVTTGSLHEESVKVSSEAIKESENYESEFSDQFLNGEGEFSESKSNGKSSKKKNKKKKKSKKK